MKPLKKQKILAELASHFEVHPNQISKWKRGFFDNAEQAFDVFSAKSDKSEKVDLKVL